MEHYGLVPKLHQWLGAGEGERPQASPKPSHQYQRLHVHLAARGNWQLLRSGTAVAVVSGGDREETSLLFGTRSELLLIFVVEPREFKGQATNYLH